MRDELLFDNMDKMLELVRVSNTIENDGGVTRGHVVALESIIPGIITDHHSADSFTRGVSDYNNDTAYACVNRWALEHGLPEEDVALESWSTFAKVAAGVGIFAAVVALIKWIMGLFGKGGGGGRKITAPANKPKQVISEVDKIIKINVLDFTANAADAERQIKEREKQRAIDEAAYEKAKAVSDKEWRDTQDAIRKEELYEEARKDLLEGKRATIMAIGMDALALEGHVKCLLGITMGIYPKNDFATSFEHVLTIKLDDAVKDVEGRIYRHIPKCLLGSSYKTNMVMMKDFVTALLGFISGSELAKLTTACHQLINEPYMEDQESTLIHEKTRTLFIDSIKGLPGSDVVEKVKGLDTTRYTPEEIADTANFEGAAAAWPFLVDLADELEKLMGEGMLRKLTVDMMRIDRDIAAVLNKVDPAVKDSLLVVKDNLTQGLTLGLRLCNSIVSAAEDKVRVAGDAFHITEAYKAVHASTAKHTVTAFNINFKSHMPDFKGQEWPSLARINDVATAQATVLTDSAMPPGAFDAWSKFMNSENPFTF